MEYELYESNRLGFSKYLAKCFLWMFLGLLASFATAATFTYAGIFEQLIMNTGTSFVLICAIVEIILVISVSRSVSKLNASVATGLFVAYSIINGVTLSSIFFLYELSSIIYVFLASAAVFGLMALVGYTTDLDLSKLGTFITVALFGMIITGFILMFSFSETSYLIYSLIGTGLFMIITTFDVQNIKRMYNESASDNEKNSLAIYGALQLYLDFINLFIHLISIFGIDKD
jgi:FtsH-binding integral membrane protein